ncbi:hypothetical protein Tco_0988712 [Tanacetum coccineum]|uniref:Uncharacterized protein n=1 Tax=Tanacetum coccineum TaxID=301880 RepID=A0ABQ5ESE2_9ASTR
MEAWIAKVAILLALDANVIREGLARKRFLGYLEYKYGEWPHLAPEIVIGFNDMDSHKDGDGDALFQLNSDSLPHAHAQTTKTYYKHQDSRIMKTQELKTKTSAQTLVYKIFLQRYQVYQGRLLASFQDDAKYEHVGQDTRSQGGKDDQEGRIKI